MTSIKNINQNIKSKLETDFDTESEEELVIKIKKTTNVISKNESESYKKILLKMNILNMLIMILIQNWENLHLDWIKLFLEKIKI
jgi:hypothetical protein